MPSTHKRLKYKVKVGATHHKNGKLVLRMTSLPPLAPLTCPKLTCIIDFIIDNIRYGYMLQYQKERGDYAEAFPTENIKMKYRTGEDYPEGIWSSIWEIIKLRTRRKKTWLKHRKF